MLRAESSNMRVITLHGWSDLLLLWHWNKTQVRFGVRFASGCGLVKGNFDSSKWLAFSCELCPQQCQCHRFVWSMRLCVAHWKTKVQPVEFLELSLGCLLSLPDKKWILFCVRFNHCRHYGGDWKCESVLILCHWWLQQQLRMIREAEFERGRYVNFKWSGIVKHVLKKQQGHFDSIYIYMYTFLKIFILLFLYCGWSGMSIMLKFWVLLHSC